MPHYSLGEGAIASVMVLRQLQLRKMNAEVEHYCRKLLAELVSLGSLLPLLERQGQHCCKTFKKRGFADRIFIHNKDFTFVVGSFYFRCEVGENNFRVPILRFV
jgi:hypothetical protein